MLLPAKLASTGVDGRGNGFRITEYYTKNYKGREAATPDALATIFYEAVRKDVQDEINGGQKGSLVWLVIPKALQAHYVRIGREVVHHKSESAVKTKRVSTESAGERADNLAKMEVYYDALGHISPRSSALRGFINDVKENAAFSTSEALKVVKRFRDESDWRIAVNILQTHLAAERDGGLR
jgi:hypothetical protein